MSDTTNEIKNDIPKVEPVVINEKIVKKISSKSDIPKPVIVKPEIPITKRKYTKDPNKKYGRANPEVLKTLNKSKPEIKEKPKVVKSNIKNVERTNVILEKKVPSKTGFYIGLTIGCIITALGIYYIYKRVKEHLKANEEIEMLKSIGNTLVTEQENKV